MTPEEFIQWLGPVAQRICPDYKLPASCCIAQGALESGWNKYTIGEFNLFGRKWGGWGNYIENTTQEFIDGEWITIVDKFQDYNTLEDAVKDWCVLLTEEPRYVNNVVYNEGLEQFVKTMGVIYATDPDYGDKILSTIHANDLTQFDA